jgi:hypothetical protein
VGQSFRNILVSIGARAEFSGPVETFVSLIDGALQGGNTIILIDGLDEISDEKDRIAFAQQLRIFLSIYPHVQVVVTSRVAGFRVIAGALSTACEEFSIVNFTDDDILELTVAWHEQIFGSTKEVREEAEHLAETITSLPRVRALATNPLLLTTLLLVKRWLGRLPTRRTVLYGKAIEVLLMTWNVAGYEPIDQDEAVPQLAFVALRMMEEGIQQISLKRLQEFLADARTQMPEILGFAKLTIGQFVERVELRSSLLILTGHIVEDGTLYPLYEFQHLTFQEYLAARAIADGYYSDPGTRSFIEVLEPHLLNQRWSEVVAMVSVLAGRRAHLVAKRLIELNQLDRVSTLPEAEYPAVLLCNCIVDEPMLAPDVLDSSLVCIARYMGMSQSWRLIFTTKYADAYEAAIQQVFVHEQRNLLALGYIIGGRHLENTLLLVDKSTRKLVNHLIRDFDSPDGYTQAKAALAVMRLAARSTRGGLSYDPELDPARDLSASLVKKLKGAVIDRLFSTEEYIQMSCAWALVWIAKASAVGPEDTKRLLVRLVDVWQASQDPDTEWVTSWAIQNLPVVSRRSIKLTPSSAAISFIENKANSERSRVRMAAYILGYYFRTPWSDAALVEVFEGEANKSPGLEGERALTLLDLLGKKGQIAARRIRSEQFASAARPNR